MTQRSAVPSNPPASSSSTKKDDRASACEGELARTWNEAAKDAALGKTMTAALVNDVTTY
jgi:hypothetical protein